MNVAAIVVDDAGNVLLGRPARGTHCHFPQGGVKARETALEALTRELREEVGLHQWRLLAEYPGLRYAYRHKNKKSKRWMGQQQTYFLLHCPGVRPALDCSGSAEFATAEWKPLAELRPEEFVSFKREVVARALAHFFPNKSSFSLENTVADCTLQRYRYSPGAPLPTPAATPLFAGKKEELEYHMLHEPMLRLPKKQRLLIIWVAMEGAGTKKCLRHLSHTLDPLSTRYHFLPDEPPPSAAELAAVMPGAGELSFVILPLGATCHAYIRALEEAAQHCGAKVAKLALYLSRAKQLRRLAAKAKKNSPALPWPEAAQSLASLPGENWLLLPAEHGWYRDYLALLSTRQHA